MTGAHTTGDSDADVTTVTGRIVHRLIDTINRHAWDELAGLLHPDFRCYYVHTGERFDRASWVRVNAHYPGFERMVLQDVLVCGGRAAARILVTGRTADGVPRRALVASFATVRDGLVTNVTEVWTQLDQSVPVDARP